MVYGELGRFPLEISIKLRMISYWRKLLYNDKLSSYMYRLLLCVNRNDNINFKWISCIESIFNDIGMGHVFANQDNTDYNLKIRQILQDQFIQKWYSEIQQSSRGQFYSSFKGQFGFEKYLIKIPENSRVWITKFRLSNLKIPVETGRWQNIPMEERICQKCNQNIGDEYHYLFICNFHEITTLRENLIPRYYLNHPNRFKLIGLLSYCNVTLYKKIAIFIRKLVQLL